MSLSPITHTDGWCVLCGCAALCPFPFEPAESCGQCRHLCGIPTLPLSVVMCQPWRAAGMYGFHLLLSCSLKAKRHRLAPQCLHYAPSTGSVSGSPLLNAMACKAASEARDTKAQGSWSISLAWLTNEWNGSQVRKQNSSLPLLCLADPGCDAGQATPLEGSQVEELLKKPSLWRGVSGPS